MVERTGLVVAGKKTMVPRLLKRALQIAATVTLTASVLLVVIVGNGFLVGKAPSFKSGWNLWLAFIQRPDILSTMILTAIVAVLFLYWQRTQEQRFGGSSRSSG
jgi:ABC-type sulfate transport system permease subunit